MRLEAKIIFIHMNDVKCRADYMLQCDVIYLSTLLTDISLFGFNIFETSGDETQKTKSERKNQIQKLKTLV